MVEKAVFGMLNVNGVTAIVGTDPVRVFPSIAPEGADTPLIVYAKVGASRTHVSGHDTDLASAHIRVACWADTALGAITLAAAVRAAMQDYSGTAGGVTVQRVFLEDESSDYDDVVQRHVSEIDFTVWFVE
jgi:hypothetical protein